MMGMIFDFYFIGQKNDALDNDEKIRTFSKIKSDLDIKEIIKKKLQTFTEKCQSNRTWKKW